MKKIHHVKIKNSAVLFELLSRQLSADAINGNLNSKALFIIKEYFGKNSEISKELELYQALMTNKFKNYSSANALIETVIRVRTRLDESKIRRAKYNIIKEIMSVYNVNDFFNSTISNYKEYAAIYKLFESVIIKDTFEPADIARSRTTIVEHIINNTKTRSEKKSTAITEYEKQPEDIRLLTTKILIERFNQKYSSLSKLQKMLLREYINNSAGSLKKYIGIQIPILETELKKLTPNVTDKITRIKLHEVVNQLDKIIKGRNISDNQVSALLKYYSLLSELKHASLGEK